MLTSIIRNQVTLKVTIDNTRKGKLSKKKVTMQRFYHGHC